MSWSLMAHRTKGCRAHSLRIAATSLALAISPHTPNYHSPFSLLSVPAIRYKLFVFVEVVVRPLRGRKRGAGILRYDV